MVSSIHHGLIMIEVAKNVGWRKLNSHDFTERSRTGRHEDLPDPIVKVLNTLVRDPKVCLSSPLFCRLLDQLPHSILDRILLSVLGPTSRQDTDFETAHREQELGVLGTIDGTECIVPFDCGERSR